MLTIKELSVDHGAIRALHEVSFNVEKGQLAAVIGANGAGKTTLLRALSGLNKASHGQAHWGDHNILHSKPEALVRHGISHVSEGKSVIPELTVAENLDLGALWRRNRKEAAQTKNEVVDPSIVGATESQALNALSPLGLTLVISEKRFDEEVGDGQIIESDPAGGGKVDAGGQVKAIISKGPERYVIPMLVGLTPEAAVNLLAKYPIKVGELKEVFNDRTPKGFVISSSPAQGQKVKRDATVDILLSKGVETLDVVSYVGKSADQALNELTEAGFDVETVDQFSENVLAGAVISQVPSGGAPLPKGEKIALTISKGSQFVFIPNVFSLTEAKARAALADLELKVVVKKIGAKKVKTVTNIAPKVGTKVKRGSTVTITVG